MPKTFARRGRYKMKNMYAMPKGEEIREWQNPVTVTHSMFNT